MKILILIIFSSILCAYSGAESRDSLRQSDLKREFNVESLEEKQKKIKEQNDLRPDDTKLGLFELSDTAGGTIKTKDIPGLFLKYKKGHFYKLTIKVLCADKEEMFQVVPRYKSLNWKIKVSESEELNGVVSTNEKGAVSILLRSPTAFLSEKISIELNEKTVEIGLLDGPYEIFFPQDACSKEVKKSK
ncbi:MAG: hypothetical protein JNM24_07405 [Bdellovibrionaceae bacterium]|nr:hypothetical protein [Pseudobdellovibrionaceae bacterium]